MFLNVSRRHTNKNQDKRKRWHVDMREKKEENTITQNSEVKNHHTQVNTYSRRTLKKHTCSNTHTAKQTHSYTIESFNTTEKTMQETTYINKHSH